MRPAVSNKAAISVILTFICAICLSSFAYCEEAAPPRSLKAVQKRINEVYDAIQESGDFVAGEIELTDIFDAVIAHVPEHQDETFIEAAYSLRLIRQLAEADKTPHIELLEFLRSVPDLAKALAFLINMEDENMNEVFSMLDKLRKMRGGKLNEYSNLAAAFCVVHDKPLARRINENRAQAPDVIELFDFYLANEKQMYFGLKDIPAELLVYVVDVTSSIEEMIWALNRYAGDDSIGSRFFDIQYDYDHYRKGTPKKVTLAGWNLPNIFQYGGVCADQAYFAVAVGKAIGVPTAYTFGRSADVAHAWVGFLQANKKNAWWNFDTGRYGAYQGLRGIVSNPQTRKPIDDSSISLIADFSLNKIEDRYTGAAMTDAAMRLAEIHESGAEFKPEAVIETSRSRLGRTLRTPDVKWQLVLLESALKKSPGYARAWFAVTELAESGSLKLADKKRWAGVLDKLCGKKYPAFTLTVLGPMIESVEDVKEQNKFWNAAFQKYQQQFDLAASIRMAQAEMWESAEQSDKAGQCYMDVIQRYANAGPFVRTALNKAEMLLISTGRQNDIIPLYAGTWNRIQQPEEMAGMFARQSNWYQVGMTYADKLEKAGQKGMAAQVRAKITNG